MLRTLLDKGLEVHLIVTDTQRIADWHRQLQGYRERVRTLIFELGLEDHVKFERVAFADMPSLYNRADVVLYPTIRNEPYGLVPLEAMSCARPIVASRSGGIAETVVDEVTGFLVKPGDVEALAERVARLLRDTALAVRFGKAGRQHVEQSFSAERHVVTLVERYNDGADSDRNSKRLRPSKNDA